MLVQKVRKLQNTQASLLCMDCMTLHVFTFACTCMCVSVSLMGVAGGDGKLGCLCGKAGTSHLCDGSAHSSGCVVNGSNAMAAF